MQELFIIPLRVIKRFPLIYPVLLFLALTTAYAQSFSTSDLLGESLSKPTSLQFGPDGRLYVAQQNGSILAYTVVRNGTNSYSVTATETISAVKNIQNHNDDGSVFNSNQRQVTGILVTGTWDFPVLYVGSSDYRIGGGTSAGDLNLDTNSGIISRLTWNGTAWNKVDMVRGLPRSEENHANNGMQLDETTNILYVASGGNTNAGAPSNNFAYLTEYALAACILAIDVNALDAMPVYTDTRNGSKFIYDIPTLNDPTRPDIGKADSRFPYDPDHPLYNALIDVGDPWGGNDGLNQAKIVAGGPVQVFAPGFRNIYDIALTEDGRLYTWSNGANGDWGGHPHQEGGSNVTNNWLAGSSKSGAMPAGWVGQDNIADADVNNKDGLHFVGHTTDYNPFNPTSSPSQAYYGGHPTPVRANPAAAGLYTHDHNVGGNNGTAGGYWRTAVTTSTTTTLPTDWPPVPVGKANPKEGDFQNPGMHDPSIWSFEGMNSYSTNGLALYTASNFNNAKKGHLLAASHNGNVYEISLNASGTIDNPRVAINSNPDVNSFGSGFGSTPLDVIAQGDNDPFPGTVWVANYVSNSITVFEPQDYFECPSPGSAGYDPNADYDSDGYSNGQEVQVGSDPCNGASMPADADKDFIADRLDPDDDNDGIDDVSDYFPLDATNGLSTSLPVNYPLLNGDPGTGIKGLGFTGLMANGEDYLDLIQDKENSNVIILYGGAPGQLGIGGPPGDGITPGDAQGAFNNQKNAFQFGVKVTSATLPFTVESEIVGPLFNTTPENFQSAGIYIGTGDQDNYVKIVCNANGGQGGILVVSEVGGVPTQYQYNNTSIASAGYFKLMLSVNPQNGTVQPKYSVAGGSTVTVGSPINLSGSLLNTLQGSPALAIGVIATSRGSSSKFAASWDNINVTFDPVVSSGNWNIVSQTNAPTKRHENAYVQAGKKFYLMGGRGSQNKKVDIYDPATKTWTASGSNHPIELHHFQAVHYQGLIYVMGAFTGGYPSETPVDKVYIYNPANDTWHAGSTIPRPRGSAATVVYNDKIYLMGGLQDGHKGNYVLWFDEYDPKTDTWKMMPDLLRFRDHFQAAVVNNKLVAAGGRLSDADGNLASQNYPSALLPPLPSGSTNSFNVTVQKVDVFDFNTNSWSNENLPLIPTPRGGTAAAVLGNEFIVIGGESGTTTEAHGETEAFDVVQKTWRSLSKLVTEQSGSIQGRHATQAIVNNGGIYIAAGSGKQGGSSTTELNTQQAFYFSDPTQPTGTPLTLSNLTASASSVNFGQVQTGQSTGKTVTLTNTSGNQSIRLLDLTIEGNTAFQVSPPPTQKLLAPGASMVVNLVVNPSPSDQGTITATLKVKHTANANPLTISLSADVGGSTPSAPIIAINAGGSAVSFSNINWLADQYYSGGSTYKTTKAITNTENDILYQTERYGAITYNIPVPDGTYNLELHFAEIYLTSTDVGKRVFNVLAEGQTVLSNYDILTKTPANAAWIETLQNISVSDGNMTITFNAVVENPAIKAIAIYNSSGTTTTNQLPVVDAGTDKTITLPTNNLSLTATASDPDGTIASYAWQQLSGPSQATLTNASTATLTASNLIAGSYVFKVTVTDDKQATASDQLTVTVNESTAGTATDLWLEAECATALGSGWNLVADSEASGGKYLVYPAGVSYNTAPTAASATLTFNINVAQAGLYYLFARVKAPTTEDNSFWVKINGGSWIKWWEGITIGNSFLWNKVPGSPFNLPQGANTITFANREDGTQLDKMLLTLSSTAPTGTGQAASNCGTTPTNQPPVVDAGTDKTITLPTNSLSLTATASDPDGSIASYAWQQLSGPSQATLTNASTATLTASNLIAGSYVFKVTVTDDKQATASDQLTVTVNSAPGGGTASVLYRVNAGGNSQTGTPAWTADSGTQPSAYRTGGAIATTTAAIALQASVPAGTPSSLFKTERYEKDATMPMSWAFPATAGQSVEVRIFLAETYLSAAGQRIFDILIDGVVVDQAIDIFALAGGKNIGIMRSYQVTSDGTINIAFNRMTENPVVKAIEILTQGTAARLANTDVKSAVDASHSQDIIEKEAGPEVLIFPNPFVSEVTVTFSSPVDINDLSFQVITPSGVQLSPAITMHSMNDRSVELSFAHTNLSSGAYILRIENHQSKKVFLQRIVKAD